MTLSELATLPDIRFDVREGVATLAFDRPQRLNAFSAELLESSLRVIEATAQDPKVRVLTITGTGRAFCAGADVQRMRDDGGRLGSIQEAAQRVLLGLANYPKPVLGAINGVAAGAGFEISLACDIRIAARSARFKEAAMGVGLVAGDGSAWFLPRIVGLAATFELMLLEEPMDAERALAIGLVNRVVNDDVFHDEVDRLARALAEKPPLAVRLTKQSIRDGQWTALPKMLDQLLEMVARTRATEDHVEGTRAFLEKRPPRFVGR